MLLSWVFVGWWEASGIPELRRGGLWGHKPSLQEDKLPCIFQSVSEGVKKQAPRMEANRARRRSLLMNMDIVIRYPWVQADFARIPHKPTGKCGEARTSRLYLEPWSSWDSGAGRVSPGIPRTADRTEEFVTARRRMP